MSPDRFALAAAVETLVGRRNLVRGARFLLDYARRDLPNKLGENGEWLVQDIVLRHSTSEMLTVFDVGANVGAWTRRLLTTARERGHRACVHAFEPSAAAFDELVRNLVVTFAGDIRPVRCAASDHCGEGTLFKPHELAGSSSLHDLPLESGNSVATETIDLCTIDDYCRSAGIDRIDLLKIDAEGHDHVVLGGAEWLLQRQAIEVVQFEYNHRWTGARRYLKDVFDDLGPLGYQLGKVTPTAIEWYAAWNPELETLREGNYVAALPRWRHRFPELVWWRGQDHTTGARRWT